MSEENKLKIEIAPGAFDTFDGTQEELDALMAEIQTMFANMTPEELEARSTAIDEDYIDELIEEDPELAAKIFQQLTSGPNDRKLQ
jgi:hypothetical protein